MRRRPGPHLLVHVAALLLVLVVQRSWLQLDRAAFSPDEGEYALQVVALRDGSWSIEDPFIAEAPDGGFHTAFRVPTDGERLYPYVQHPTWPGVLRLADAVGGEAGMYLVPLAFGLTVPCLVWAAVRRWHPGASPVPAFWAAALSPAVVVNGSVLWAHAASAALAGAAVLGAEEVRSGRRGTASWASAACLTAVAAGVLVRSEGLLLAGALASVLAVLGARQRHRPAVLLAVAIVLAAAAAYGVEVLAQRSILGEVAQGLVVRTSESDSGYVAQRLAGATNSLVGWYTALTPAQIAISVAVPVAAGVASWAALSHRRRLAGQAAVAALVAFGLLWWSSPNFPAKGFLVAWPLAAAGLVALAADRRRVPLPALVVLVYSLAVVATIYPEGGGIEWGGRFFSPLTVPVAAAVAVPVQRWRAERASHGGADLPRWADVALVGVAAVLVVGYATTAVRGIRSGAGDVEAALAAAPPDVVITNNGLFPSVAWRLHPDVDWLVVDGQPGARTLDEAFSALDDGTARRVAALGIPEEELVRRGLEVEHVEGRLVVGSFPG